MSPGWERWLEPGERLLWQGAPEPADRDPLTVARAVLLEGESPRQEWVFLVFAVAALFILRDSGPLFEVIRWGILTGALGWIAGGMLWRRHLARATRYALTDRRALVLRPVHPFVLPLAARRIEPETAVGYDGLAPGTLWFGRTERLGFERIAGAPEVLRLVRAVQAGQA